MLCCYISFNYCLFRQMSGNSREYEIVSKVVISGTALTSTTTHSAIPCQDMMQETELDTEQTRPIMKTAAVADNGAGAVEDSEADIEDGDSDDDLAEAAKEELLKYTIVDNGVESKPACDVYPVSAIKKAASSIGQAATIMVQDGVFPSYKCTACYEIFKTGTELMEHTLEHVDAELCTNCGRAFDSSRALLIHKTYCLKTGSKLAKEQPGLFNCSLCDRSFNFKSLLANHKRTVHALKGYVCTLCDKAFPIKNDLVRHCYTHSPNKPFKCDKPGCDKSFTCKASLNKHIQLKHTADKVYRCINCSKTFKLESDIQRHMFTHTSVRPFKCTLCTKSYTCKSSLKQHINLNHGKLKQKLLCVFCARTFNTQQDLDRHVTTHTGAKPWRCSVCGKSYACKSSLSVHKRNAHEILHADDGEKLSKEQLLEEAEAAEGKTPQSEGDDCPQVKKKRGRKPKKRHDTMLDMAESQKGEAEDLKISEVHDIKVKVESILR